MLDQCQVLRLGTSRVDPVEQLVDGAVGVLSEIGPFLCSAAVAHPEERLGIVDVVVVPVESVVLVCVVGVPTVVDSETMESILESDGVVVHPQVLDFECALGSAPAVFLRHVNAAVVVFEGVSVDLDVRGTGDLDAGFGLLEAVSFDPVVPYDSVIGDLVKDPRPIVVDHRVALIEGAHVVVVGPQTRSVVVVDVVVSDDEVRRLEELGASCFPTGRVVVSIVVESDLVTLDEDTGAVALDANLTVVMDVVVDHAVSITEIDTRPPIVVYLVVANGPCGAATADGTLLRWSRVPLDDQALNQHVAGRALERMLDIAPTIENGSRFTDELVTVPGLDALAGVDTGSEIESRARGIGIHNRLDRLTGKHINTRPRKRRTS